MGCESRALVATPWTNSAAGPLPTSRQLTGPCGVVMVRRCASSSVMVTVPPVLGLVRRGLGCCFSCQFLFLFFCWGEGRFLGRVGSGPPPGGGGLWGCAEGRWGLPPS